MRFPPYVYLNSVHHSYRSMTGVTTNDWPRQPKDRFSEFHINLGSHKYKEWGLVNSPADMKLRRKQLAHEFTVICTQTFHAFTHRDKQSISEMVIDTALKSMSYTSAPLPSTTSLSYMMWGIHDLHSKRGGCLVCSTSNSSDKRGKGGWGGWWIGAGVGCVLLFFFDMIGIFGCRHSMLLSIESGPMPDEELCNAWMEYRVLWLTGEVNWCRVLRYG